MRFLLFLAILTPLAAQTLLQQNFDTRNYRAGSTTAGIQEALNKATAAGGGTVVMPVGSLSISSTITLSGNGITLRGAGGMCCGIGTTIHRTGDFGNSITVTGNGVTLDGFALVQDINYVTGNPGTISNTPTHGAHIEMNSTNTATLKNLRLENMPYNVLIHNGASITVKDSQFLGIWDRQMGGPQVTIASILVDSVAGGIPTYIHLDNNVFYGTANTAPSKHNVGPKAMVQIDACEDCYIVNGSMGGGGISNLWLHPNNTTTGPALANVRIQNIKFDSAQDQDLLISGDGVKGAGAILVNDNVFNGEYTSDFAVTIANAGSGVPPVSNLVMNGNTVFAYLSTAFNLLDGLGLVAAGNSIRAYNGTNAYATAAGSSAIYIGGRANQINLTGNQIGGGQGYANFGTGGNFCNFGIKVADISGLNTAVRLSGNFPPYYAALGNYDELNLGSRFSGYPNRDVVINSGAGTGSIAYNCETDDGSANIPCEFRGTKYSFPIGVQVFANNAAALTGGLVAGDIYKTSTGQLMIVF